MTNSHRAGSAPVSFSPLVTDLLEVRGRAAAQRSDTDAFGHFIDIMWEREGRPDAELDSLVDALAAEVAAGVDCTRCANCCRMPVGLEPRDVERLAEGLHLTPETVLDRWVDRASGPEWDEWAVMRGVPCPLLQPSADRALCAVYTHRPGACRAYPALTPDFRWMFETLADDAGLCPIIFNVIERLKEVLGWQSD